MMQMQIAVSHTYMDGERLQHAHVVSRIYVLTNSKLYLQPEC